MVSCKHQSIQAVSAKVYYDCNVYSDSAHYHGEYLKDASQVYTKKMNSFFFKLNKDNAHL